MIARSFPVPAGGMRPLACDATTSSAKWERGGRSRRFARSLACLGLWCAADAHRDDLSLKDTVIIFARVPRLGAVKRRLAQGISQRAALTFPHTTLERTPPRDRRFRGVLAATPDYGRTSRAARLPRTHRGSGDIGWRMHRAVVHSQRGRVVILDNDIPDLAAVFAGRGRGQAVFAPAIDGGQWLARPFAAVHWSRNIDTPADLRAWQA